LLECFGFGSGVGCWYVVDGVNNVDVWLSFSSCAAGFLCTAVLPGFSSCAAGAVLEGQSSFCLVVWVLCSLLFWCSSCAVRVEAAL